MDMPRNEEGKIVLFLNDHVLFQFDLVGGDPDNRRWPRLGELLGVLGHAEFDPDPVLTPLADGSVLVRLNTKEHAGDVAEFVVTADEFLRQPKESKSLQDFNRNLLDRGLQLKAVIPNWLGGAAVEPSIKGGPGGAPSDLSASDTAPLEIGFNSPDPLAPDALKPLLRKCPVVVDVFILDTVPANELGKEKDLGSRMTNSGETKFKVHPMGKLWTSKFPFSAGVPNQIALENGAVAMTVTRAESAQLESLSVHPDPFSKDLNPVSGPVKILDHDYDMSDHGLFIAGLIKSSVQKARIHLIQVLNNDGVGSFEMMAQGFAQVKTIRTVLGVDESPYLVNCSFTLTMPRLEPGKTNSKVGDYPSAHSAEGLSQRFSEWLRLRGEMQTLRLLQAAAHDVLCDQEFSGVLAAAGNESQNMQPPYAARYPAALEQVLGVGALDNAGARADYSNYPDDPVWAGVMALGELIGLSTKSKTGFVRWKGTSFATPLVTGRFADLISKYDVGFRQLVDKLILPPVPPPPFHEIAATQH